MFKNWPNKKSFILSTIFALILFALPFSYSSPLVTADSNYLNSAFAQSDVAKEENFDAIGGFIYSSLAGLGAIIANLGGILLDISLSWFVFAMTETSEKFGLSTVIEEVWELVRDLFNLLFIFGILYIGFKIILGIDESDSRRNLGMIVVAALLINFSLYVSQVVVDFGNIAAAEVATLFDVPEAASERIFGIKTYHISNSFIEVTKIENITNNALSHVNELKTGQIAVPDKKMGPVDALLIGFIVCLLLMVLGFVFAAGAILMFTRFIYLLFIMMFSPFMFLGLVIPELKQYTEQWWSKLIYQTLVGPAYLFTLYISLLALTAMKDRTSDGDVGLWGFIMLSLIVSAFAFGSLKLAREMGAIGATQAVGIGKGVGRWTRSKTQRAAGAASFGSAAAFFRSTVGSGAHNLSNKEELKDAASRKGPRGFAARRVLNLSRKAADTSFDARKIRGIGKTLDIGEGRKGGYVSVAKEKEQRDQEFADSLGTVKDTDPKVAALQTEVDSTEQEIEASKNKLKNLRKQGAAKEEIDSTRIEIEDLESKKKKQTQSVQRERYRRQIGSLDEYVVSDINDKKATLKKRIDEYNLNKEAEANARNDTEREKAREERKNLQNYIAATKKEISELEKKAREKYSGYSQVVEDSPWWKNIFFERTKGMNADSASKIREKYEKNIKENKSGKKDSSGDNKSKN